MLSLWAELIQVQPIHMPLLNLDNILQNYLLIDDDDYPITNCFVILVNIDPIIIVAWIFYRNDKTKLLFCTTGILLRKLSVRFAHQLGLALVCIHHVYIYFEFILVLLKNSTGPYAIMFTFFFGKFGHNIINIFIGFCVSKIISTIWIWLNPKS